MAQTWLCLAFVAMVGPLATEPAAMTLTSCAAPPVLRVAAAGNGDSTFMTTQFG